MPSPSPTSASSKLPAETLAEPLSEGARVVELPSYEGNAQGRGETDRWLSMSEQFAKFCTRDESAAGQERANEMQTRLRKQYRVADTQPRNPRWRALARMMERAPEMQRESLGSLDRYLSRDVDRQYSELELHGSGIVEGAETINEGIGHHEAS